RASAMRASPIRFCASSTAAWKRTATSVAVSTGPGGAWASRDETVSSADKQRDERAAWVLIFLKFSEGQNAYGTALLPILVRLSFERAETTISFGLMSTIM